MEKYLWKEMQPPEDLFELVKTITAALREIKPDDPDQAQTLTRADALLQVLGERVKSQSDQMINLTAVLSETMGYEALLDTLFTAGIKRNEMLSCWDIPAEDALRAELRFKEKQKQALKQRQQEQED